MEIKLNDKWKITSDRYQYKIIRIGNKNREFVEGYYNSLENCILVCIDLQIRLSKSNSIQTLLNEIKSLQTALNKALQPLKLEVKPISELNKEEIKNEN